MSTKRSKAVASQGSKGRKVVSASETSRVPLPDWPQFKPLIPTEDLEFEEVLPSQIVVVKQFWTPTLCKNYVSFLRTLPLVTTPGRPKKGEALRVNDRYEVNDPFFANRLWVETGLRELVCDHEQAQLWGGEPIGLNPRIRIYRYSEGQYFDCHYDESNNVTLSSPSTPSSTQVQAKTTWTALLYLTSAATGCIGGETIFYPDDAKKLVVELETGMLLLHKHGQDCMLHEGSKVVAGEKWVIRSDICVKR